jgi:allophanate hydrolase
LPASAAPRAPEQPKEGWIAIAVVGAHLSGLPLNGELVDLGATFLKETKTTADYRLYELAGSRPAKPGLLRVADGAGNPMAVEVWTLDAAGFGVFVAKIPPPLGIGTIRLADGSSVKGFLVEAEAVAAAKDISKFGGWRAYLETPSAREQSSQSAY